MSGPGTLKIGRRAGSYAVRDFAQASALYCNARDRSGEGGSTFPPGRLTLGGKRYYVSYNGRIWAGTPRQWKPGDQHVYPAVPS